MSLRSVVKDYFTFSKKERIATFSVLLLLSSIYVFPFLFDKSSNTNIIHEDTALTAHLKNAQAYKQDKETGDVDEDLLYHYPAPSAKVKGYIEGELFLFDPNTLPTEGWQRLGLQQKTINIINNYRNKGGHFYKPDDLKKIWGLPDGFYNRVASYIQIKDQPHISKSNYHTAAPTYERTARTINTVSVNEADTTELIALPGIGSKLAQRIVNFRDKLGGFATVEQISETYGLPDSTYQKLKPYFKVNGHVVRKYKLNTATKDELKTHPYIRWNLANAIVEYRNQHGAFSSINDLKNIVLIDENTFDKIAPYFEL